MGDWLKEVDKHAQPEDTIKMLIANKSDMQGERQVSAEDIKVNLLKGRCIEFYEAHWNSCC